MHVNATLLSATLIRHREPLRSERPRARPLDNLPLEIVLDRVSEGLIVIDELAAIQHANRQARELLYRLNPLMSGHGKLRFAHGPTQAAWLRALCGCRGVVAADDDDAEPAPRQFLARDPDGEVLAHASIESLCRQELQVDVATLWLVVLSPVPAQRRVSGDVLMALYGLTAAEARIAAEVTMARTLEDLAAGIGVSVNTVKTHLKRVFIKCSVGSFAQLTALVATIPRPRAQSQRVTDSMSTGRTSARLTTVPT